MEMLWFWMVSVVVALYAVMDGFDFGAGALHLFVARDDRERREVLAAIGPLWDGNEVWLLAGGGLLFLGFPRVLAAGFSGFYLAMFMVIWTLIIRGISIEFRSHVADRLWRAFWDGAFALASALMPVLLGAALGNVVRGVPLDGSGFFNIPLFTHWGVGNPVGILDWYTLLTGLLVLATLTAHGALFLAWKTSGAVHRRCMAAARPLWAVVAVLALAATFATARVNPDVYARLPHAPLAWAGMALFLAGLGTVAAGLAKGRPLAAFLGSGAFIVGLLAATAACVWPVMLRSTLDPAFSLDAHNANAGAYGLRTGLRWWVLAFPIVIAYFAMLFRIHRGKVEAAADGEGY
ncbi:cytochrome d ubiquinol oxidase subunit II [Mesoterricola silvestris]|uniref:Cytochrome D oxidase subunit I n=1 Tax=Mesoterricola silvestris TaxID=2927979 RepID=A0AA48K708_9BACT|nr:cytochrome d ubiquinol oxidase subunit II [Mesoterricola silvestris]BDU71359.1 cytochrome D oxidase subunit I [Mesoterricola silvestris]